MHKVRKGEGVFLVADQVPELSSSNDDRGGEPRLYAQVAHLTDVGRRRHNNQDNHLILPLGCDNLPPDPEQGPIEIEKGGLLVAVADGMGGHFGGEEASRLCVERLAKEIMTQLQVAENGHPDLPAVLQKTVEMTHQAVFAHAQGYAEKLTMGTTLTAVLLQGAHADIAQVGDSRAYLLRDGNLILLTQDQTIGNQLRSRGEDFTKVDAHIQEMLVQAIGAQAGIDVIMAAIDLEPQDVLLLCSDGLYKVVSPADIVQTLELEMGLREKATHLVARANEGGGPDNITVILTEICQLESTG
jgi:serine/threonine protein phosphatase PrpC